MCLPAPPAINQALSEGLIIFITSTGFGIPVMQGRGDMAVGQGGTGNEEPQDRDMLYVLPTFTPS